MNPSNVRFARGLVTLAVLAGLMACAEDSRAQKPATATVYLNGHPIAAEIAETREQQSRGLSGRAALGPDEGMLFIYAEEGNHRFWMRDMLISIDMIWIRNLRIVHIESFVPVPAPGTPVNQLPTYSASEPSNFVLEIAAGRSAELSIAVGGRVRFDFN